MCSPKNFNSMKYLEINELSISFDVRNFFPTSHSILLVYNYLGLFISLEKNISLMLICSKKFNFALKSSNKWSQLKFQNQKNLPTTHSNRRAEWKIWVLQSAEIFVLWFADTLYYLPSISFTICYDLNDTYVLPKKFQLFKIFWRIELRLSFDIRNFFSNSHSILHVYNYLV
jgi:hypothetical protein